MKKIIIAIIIFIIALGLFLKITKKPAPTKLQKVTIMMPFISQIQWAAYYATLKNGYYQDEGLDVNILYSAKGNVGPVEQLIGGKVDLIMTGEESVIMARSKGLDVVAVYPIGPTNVYYIVSQKNKNINKPLDLVGKKVGVLGAGSATSNNLLAILSIAKIDKNDVDIINAGMTKVPAFLEGKFDAASVHLTELLQIEKKIPDEELFQELDRIARYHIATSGKLIKSNPDLISKFLKATKKGIEFSANHPEETVNIFNSLNPDAKSQKKDDLDTWNALVKEFHYKASLPGLEKSENWQKSQDVLFNTGMITKKTDVASMFTNKFIPK